MTKVPTQRIDNALIDRNAVKTMLERRIPDHTLEQPFYNSEALFQIDMEEIFHKEWIFAGVSCDLPKRGSFITVDIGLSSVIILRDNQDQIRAFHNTCRHRGSKICLTAKGKSPKLVCPYHQWAYDLDGSLVFNGQDMDESFDRSTHGLSPVHCQVAGGYIFVCLADNPPPIEDFVQDMEYYLEPHDLYNAKVAVQSEIIEKANWKLVVENNRECYHCDSSHPELLNSLLEWDDNNDPRATPEFIALVEKQQTFWSGMDIPYQYQMRYNNRNRIVRTPLKEGTHSMTMDGQAASKKLLGRITSPDLGALRILHLPNSWNHGMGDHHIAFQILPISPQETKVITRWLVHKDAVEGVDYDPENLRRVWDATNDQDRTLSENNQLGVNSIGYRPGPYSKTYEFGVINFVNWYCERLKDNLG
ncbi:aromatic ring-hydroxylating oxygenase subunit alpha [Grimontia sp. NTOU-MAR1]|uniref:aromatic ring-hydroxylating oxygenase subunit alpha n=1 Tax=Grimontia sp. NTOU-MAR1 TaxID=3111011 RepID=UPI002DB80314|nr:aromatic ring-hydroxylating dioxygenase subunit alpha [Grimontia sp. NTOU-MAR1]WRV99022.1 aromatic ring-hydroxylating dioxygenase subunit alpha [Grimontia sp. NTOU-MAR1]